MRGEPLRDDRIAWPPKGTASRGTRTPARPIPPRSVKADRPPLSAWRFSAIFTVIAAGRYTAHDTSVPSTIRSVRLDRAASVVHFLQQRTVIAAGYRLEVIERPDPVEAQAFGLPAHSRATGQLGPPGLGSSPFHPERA